MILSAGVVVHVVTKTIVSISYAVTTLSPFVVVIIFQIHTFTASWFVVSCSPFVGVVTEIRLT